MRTKKVKSYEPESLDSIFPKVLKGGEGSAETSRKRQLEPMNWANQPERRLRHRQEADSKTGEIGSKEVAEMLPSAFEQITSEVEGTNLKGKREEAKKYQKGIEGRLESLTRMFAADKDTPTEGDTEEEEN